jgi:hypothetical protein
MNDDDDDDDSQQQQQEQLLLTPTSFHHTRKALLCGYDELVRRTLPLFISHHVRPTSLTISSPVLPGYFMAWDRDEEWVNRGTSLWLAAHQWHRFDWCTRAAEEIARAFDAAAFSALRTWQACGAIGDVRAVLTPILCDSLRILLGTLYLPTLCLVHPSEPAFTWAENASVGDAVEKCESPAAAAAVVGVAPQRVGGAPWA